MSKRYLAGAFVAGVAALMITVADDGSGGNGGGNDFQPAPITVADQGGGDGNGGGGSDVKPAPISHV